MARVINTDAELFEAARLAEAHEFITALPNGYETFIGERDFKLSGGVVVKRNCNVIG